MRRVERVVAVLFLAAVMATANDATACGPDFPNHAITEPSVLSQVALSFSVELARIPRSTLPEAAFPRSPYRDGDEDDVREIADALHERGDSPDAVAKTVEAVAAFRRALPRAPSRDEPTVRRRNAKADATPVPTPPVGLPRAFDLHLRGLAAWRTGDRAAATKAWRVLLELPADDRAPRVVWAQYMLGRIDVDSAPAAAVAWFAAVRESVRSGASDPIGLAAASVGWEARAELRRGHFVRALTLYFAVDDEASMLALLRTVFAEPARIDELAADPLTRRIATAYVVSHGDEGAYGAVDPESDRVAQWLASVEKAETHCIDDADRLAWIAYDHGDLAIARRWLARSSQTSPVAAWIDAKLLLHDGRIDEASARLAAAVRGLPVDRSDADAMLATSLLAEHGVVELARGKFVEALESLLDAGYWMDAAYVAERVLTTDELVAFVRARRPLSDGDAHAWLGGGPPVDVPNAAVHWLLARRLARDGRWAEAFPHFPADVRVKAEALSARLATGRDASSDRAVRANALRDAARLLQSDGADLVGLETAPDWRSLDGDSSSDADARPSDFLATKSPDETARTKSTETSGLRRMTADVAWEAAALMPDEGDETAEWLRDAGRWSSEHGAPGDADRFEEELIHRCGTTSLGREAVTAKSVTK